MDSPSEEFLTAKEVSELLKMSIPTVYRMAAEDVLPHVQFGGKRHSIRFLKSRLLAGVSSTSTTTSQRKSDSDRPIPGPKPKWLTEN